MFWEDKPKKSEFQVPDNVVDLLFDIQCRELPVDHIDALSKALLDIVPWLADEPQVALHTIHMAGSQNGWERPDAASGQRLIPSRRTKLTLRVPSSLRPRILEELGGAELEIEDCKLRIGQARTRLLSPLGTLFARHIVSQSDELDDEPRFMQRIANELAKLDITISKALCGKTLYFKHGNGSLAARSLMLAGLTPAESVRLQEHGVGQHQLLGCGIFIPHKGIDAVKQSSEDD